MGLKNWLFESVEPENSIEEYSAAIEEEPVEKVEVSSTELDHLIETIYAENGLTDQKKSIFKVREAIDALPAEMPAAQKLTSVLSILQISELDKATVLNDAEERLRILKGALHHINKKNADEIMVSEEQIKSFNSQIEVINLHIYETKIADETATNLVQEEILEITHLMNFLEKE